MRMLVWHVRPKRHVWAGATCVLGVIHVAEMTRVAKITHMVETAWVAEAARMLGLACVAETTCVVGAACVLGVMRVVETTHVAEMAHMSGNKQVGSYNNWLSYFVTKFLCVALDVLNLSL